MLKQLNRLPPRRRRQGAALAAATVLYSALGFLAVPLLVDSLARDYVRETLRLELSIRQVEFNPWGLAVRLDGLEVREPAGERLLAARSVYLNLDGVASLWQRRLEVDELDVLQPFVHAHVDAKGLLNLMQLVPPDDPEDQGETPWMLGALSVRNGEIRFQDDSRPRPFATTFSPLNLQLFQLSSQADGAGNYRFSAQTGQGEQLAWKGRVALNPVRSEGHLSLSGWRLETLAAYAQDQLPLALREGRFDLSGDYRLSLMSATPDVSLSNGQLTLTGIRAATRTANPLDLRLDTVALQGLALDWPAGRLSLPALRLEGGSLGDAAGRMAVFGSLALDRTTWDPAGDQAAVGAARLEELTLLDGAEALLEVPQLAVQALALAPGKQVLDTGQVLVNRGRTRVTRQPDGATNWQRYLDQLLVRLLPPAPVTGAVAASRPWQLHLGEFRVQDFRIEAEDRVPAKPVALPLYIRSLSVQPELDLRKPHRFEGDLMIGRDSALSLSGMLDEQPLRLDSRLRLTDFALPPLAPYLADLARFRLESGRLSLDGRLRVSQEKELNAGYQGSLSVRDFSASDQFLQERFLAWKQLRLSGMDVNLSPMQARVRDMTVDAPFTRLMILPDKSINISHILATSPAAGKPAPAVTGKGGGAPAMPLEVSRVEVRNGSMLFADLSLKPQFATGIESLDGEIRHVSTRPGKLAEVRLDGRVDQYGKARIEGKLNPLAPDDDTDIGLKFENVELTTLTPYAAKFAGYRIDKGKLSLDLHYRIEDRQLKAENKVVLNQLTLGEKVDSPDAVNLPLRLALAVLKDSQGVIRIDLPVSGSLDDPQFKVGPIIWKAFVNVLTKVATAPFRFIAGLVGGGDDMDSLAFAPGQSGLSADSRAKLLKLAEALRGRPELKVELRGGFDPGQDRREIQAGRLAEAVRARLPQAGTEARALELLYAERFGGEALKQQQALALRPAGESGLKPSAAALSATLQAALTDKEVVDDGDLRQLALDRSRAMRAVLIEEGGVGEGRVFVLEPESAAGQPGTVISKLTLNAL